MKYKFILIYLSIFSLTILFSCKKSNIPNNTVNPISKFDTLTTGWTNITTFGRSFVDVFFKNDTVGYALENHYCYKSVDEGNTWFELPTNLNSNENLAVTNDGKIFVVNHSASIFRSVNGGQTFTSFNSSHQNIDDIFFTDNNNGFAVFPGGILQTSDGGITWNTISIIGLNVSGKNYNSLFFINSSTGWIIDSNDVYRTNGAINYWAKSNFTGTPSTRPLQAIFAVSSALVYAGSDDGKIFKSIDGGANFSPIATLPSPSKFFLDLHFIDANIGYVCYGSRIYKTTNAGILWVQVVSIAKGNITEIHFTNSNHGWGCTSNGTILRFAQ